MSGMTLQAILVEHTMADIQQLWQQYFPELAADDTPVMQSLREHAGLARLPAGQPVFHVGNACEQYLLVV
ncbi:MAG: hypothetical protein WD601_08945, partial [Pseudohongiellaceae bacterium]